MPPISASASLSSIDLISAGIAKHIKLTPSNPIPFKHPEKSSIFLGTRFIPFPLTRGRGRFFLKRDFVPL
jgi:hypothetical protein